MAAVGPLYSLLTVLATVKPKFIPPVLTPDFAIALNPRMTWSIVTHDPATGAFAVAVATKAFAVGASCPFVRSGVGAVSTQSFTNRYLGPAILDAMARGLPPDAAIEGALAGDAGRGLRQVHAVDRHGRTAAWTGQNCVEWCGSVAAPGISVAGNMLAGEPTVAATLAAWQANPALELPERLMVAMEAGEAAGGDRRGRQSAAMVLTTTEDFPGPQPAGGRQHRIRCRNCVGCSASGGPSAPRASPPSRRAPTRGFHRPRRDRGGLDRPRARPAAPTLAGRATLWQIGLAYPMVSRILARANSSGGDSRLLRRRVAAQLLATTAVAAALGSSVRAGRGHGDQGRARPVADRRRCGIRGTDQERRADGVR